MAMAAQPVPVRLRLGALREWDLGTVTPVVHFQPGPVPVTRVDLAGPLAELLRDIADQLIRGG